MDKGGGGEKRRQSEISMGVKLKEEKRDMHWRSMGYIICSIRLLPVHSNYLVGALLATETKF